MLSKVHMLLTMLMILGIPIMCLVQSHTHRVQWSLMFLSLAQVSLRLLSLAQVSLSLAQVSLLLQKRQLGHMNNGLAVDIDSLHGRF